MAFSWVGPGPAKTAARPGLGLDYRPGDSKARAGRIQTAGILGFGKIIM